MTEHKIEPIQKTEPEVSNTLSGAKDFGGDS